MHCTLLQPSVSFAVLRLLPEVCSSALHPVCLLKVNPVVQAHCSFQQKSQDALLVLVDPPSQASRPFSTAVSIQTSHSSNHKPAPVANVHRSDGIVTAAGATITAGVHQAAASGIAKDSQHLSLAQPPINALPGSATEVSLRSHQVAASQAAAQHTLQHFVAAPASHLLSVPTPHPHLGTNWICSPSTTANHTPTCSHSGFTTRALGVISKRPQPAQTHRCFAASPNTQAAGCSTGVQHRHGAKAGPIAVAISGGVDSAVAALLLKQAG